MISRRNLLQMMGLAGASYFLPSLGGRSKAHANGPPIPRRIVFFYTEQGTLKRAWRPTLPGTAPDATTITTPWSTNNHVLGDLHQPLVSLKDRLLFLDGLDMASAFVDPTPPANSHVAGETHALVANNRQSDVLAGGSSIDQYIAKAINASMPVTRFPSLELHIDEWGRDTGNEAHPVYAGAGEPVPLLGNAGAIYDRLFPNGPVGSTPEQKAEVARSVAEQKAILEFAKNDFTALGSRLGKADRERLSAHASAVSDLSNRLAIAQNAACSQPDRSLVAGTGAGAYELNSDVMMRLAQTALSCDLTRVVTLYLSDLPYDTFGYRSVGGTSDSHDMIHKTANTTDALYENTDAVDIVKRYYTYYAMQYAKFLKLLDSIPEADGGTLLDHTLVVWCGQIAAGDHSVDNLPWVLGGRMGGAVKPGRYIRYPRTPDEHFWPAYSHGPAHSNLFVSLANMMGIDTNTFGNPATCTGPLAGLT